MVLVEDAEVLGQHVERPTRCAEGAAVDAVTVGGTENIWSGLVDLGVDSIGGWVGV